MNEFCINSFCENNTINNVRSTVERKMVVLKVDLQDF